MGLNWRARRARLGPFSFYVRLRVKRCTLLNRTSALHRCGALGALAALPCSTYSPEAAAHMMGITYNLPIPFWMYAFAASAALALSFLIVAFFLTVGVTTRPFQSGHLGGLNEGVSGGLLRGGRALGVFALLLTVAAGLAGPANPFANFSTTFFWIVFVLAFSYLTAFIGDVYGLINPWRTIAVALARPMERGRFAYPSWLGYYPALVFYMAFIWIELFHPPPPRALAETFIAYAMINTAGAVAFGPGTWFRYGEFFGVFLRMIGKVAPLAWTQRDVIAVRLRPPFVGLLEEQADHFSLVVFVLFMLSSTAFDGLHDTGPWVGLFWHNLFPLLSILPGGPDAALKFYNIWQWLTLFLSPFAYLAVYLFFVWVMKRAAGSELTVRDLALRFAPTLVPIAVVYHITHYYTLLFDQIPVFVWESSDPLGLGWNLFGTARQSAAPLIIAANSVWHTQVGLILFGHIASVYVAHLQGLRTFGSARKALRSQLPMLVLMMLFTTMGLWILSLPIASGQVQDPLPSLAPGLSQ